MQQMKTTHYTASKQGRLLFFIFPVCAASSQEHLPIKGGLFSAKHNNKFVIQV